MLNIGGLNKNLIRTFSSKVPIAPLLSKIRDGSFKVFHERPEPLIGVASTVILGIASVAYFDTWFPFLEGAHRFCRSVTAAAIISADYKWGRKWLLEKGMRAEDAERTVHQRSAERLLKLFKTQGGVYVKAGQHMSSLYYLLPKEYCSTLAVLHNQATSKPFESILPVLRSELGASASDCFESLDVVPVAAASIAQVHKARYNGMDVAVKVQFPDVDRLSTGDVRTIEIITNFISWAFPEFKLKWLVREFDNNLPLELDFTHEAANSNRTRKLFAHNPRFSTPKIYHATKKVLIMEWIEGVHIDEPKLITKLGFSPSEVAYELNRAFSEQIFVHRFVHCDPHAGNVLVRKMEKKDDFQIVLLDNGLYREYTEEFCLDYAQLWMAILRQDEQALSKAAKRLNVNEHRLFASILTARSWEGMKKTLFQGMAERELSHIQSQAALRAAAITDILATVPSPLLLVLKTNDLLRSINMELGVPTLSVFSCTMYACQKTLQKYEARFQPGILWGCRRMLQRWQLNAKLFILHILSWLGRLPSAI
jgi:aarF domain-containing kinase